MKRDSLQVRRAAEVISLTDLHRVYDPDSPLSLGGDIDDEDRLSKGSDCCLANVYKSTDNKSYCSKCGELCEELLEDDDEYLDRLSTDQAQAEEINGFLDDVYDNLDGEGGGY